MSDPIRGIGPVIPIEVPQGGQTNGAPAAAAATEQAAQQQAAAAAATAASSDSADVSHAEALLTTITAAAADIATIDEARVAALREAIQSGTFQADPQQIAQRIVEIERLLAATEDGS